MTNKDNPTPTPKDIVISAFLNLKNQDKQLDTFIADYEAGNVTIEECLLGAVIELSQIKKALALEVVRARQSIATIQEKQKSKIILH